MRPLNGSGNEQSGDRTDELPSSRPTNRGRGSALRVSPRSRRRAPCGGRLAGPLSGGIADTCSEPGSMCSCARTPQGGHRIAGVSCWPVPVCFSSVVYDRRGCGVCSAGSSSATESTHQEGNRGIAPTRRIRYTGRKRRLASSATKSKCVRHSLDYLTRLQRRVDRRLGHRLLRTGPRLGL